MLDNWQSLVGNLAVVALFISAWDHAQFLFAGRPKLWGQIGFGLTMGCGAVASMLLAIQIAPGYFFDLRTSLIAVTSFFGGGVAALIAVLLAAGFRMGLGGGGEALGVGSIIAAAAIGLGLSRLTRRRIPVLASVAILAAAMALLATIAMVLLQADAGAAVVAQIAAPVIALSFLATAIAGLFVVRQRVFKRERDLLRAGFEESPDFQYVKSHDGRFVAVNMQVAKYHGFAAPSQMVGKSDLDLALPARARQMMERERQILESGKPMIGLEEVLGDADGTQRWFSTSKVAIHNSDGEVIGLAGVTRDITARKLLEEELVLSRNQLSYVLAEITDGIAMFDQSGVLLYCNNRYRNMFPLTANVRRPGVNIRTILRAIAEAGEQKGIPESGLDEWIEKVVKTEALGSEAEVNLIDGRWLQLRTRPTSNGFVLVVVSDMTKTKQAEAALRALTEQLTLLATTDGLTGLANRRALDEALETEIARSRRDGTPLALLMIDVDLFKLYNDIYGHPAGDEALKTVSQCLRQALKRPGDLAARYGGEEFVAILPGCTEDEALFIAEGFRDELKERAIPYARGIGGTLTVSVGLAIFDQADGAVSASDLVGRADAALYDAKDAGRDCVVGWRAQNETRPATGRRAGE
ncbi:MAG: diguanylate cyclase [Devosia nanyangense]|uniref:diguanylate cyclase n=1 Tax=Devosia nanyangense TaxID=1228055 RepID=A0A933L766_9HYPH|nr:diguanylate cyclase [Devosia nanyangense]